jgi:ribosomal-protein-alanine N-acetyltransferase
MAARPMRACPPPDAARESGAMSGGRRDAVPEPARDPSDDIDRIMEVMVRAFPPEYGEAWNRRQISDSLILAGTRYSLIMADGSFAPDSTEPVAGFALIRGLFDEEELLLFAIAPEFRRQGLGHALLLQVIAQARARGVVRIFLEMRRDNPAGHLYAAHGFRTVGIRPRYYRTASGERLDALSQELIIG